MVMDHGFPHGLEHWAAGGRDIRRLVPCSLHLQVPQGPWGQRGPTLSAGGGSAISC